MRREDLPGRGFAGTLAIRTVYWRPIAGRNTFWLVTSRPSGFPISSPYFSKSGGGVTIRGDAFETARFLPLLATIRKRSVNRRSVAATNRESWKNYTNGGNTPGRTRTCDPRFRKPVLYPLSYEGLLVLTPHSPCHIEALIVYWHLTWH